MHGDDLAYSKKKVDNSGKIADRNHIFNFFNLQHYTQRCIRLVCILASLCLRAKLLQFVIQIALRKFTPRLAVRKTS